MMKWLLGLSGLTAVCATVGFWFVRSPGESESPYTFETIRRGNLTATITASGTLEPEEVVDVGAREPGQIVRFGKDPRYSACAEGLRVTSYFPGLGMNRHLADSIGDHPIDYGSPVDVGTVLAQLDDAILKAEMEEMHALVKVSEAKLQQTQATLRQATSDWDRAQKLRGSGAITEEALGLARRMFEEAKALVALAESELLKAQKSHDKARIRHQYTTITSPVRGVIIDRRVNIGQTVVAGLNAPSLFLIAKDLKRMQIWASVNEADICNIHPGQLVHFTVDARPTEVYEGRVAPDQPRLNAVMTQNVVTYTVLVNVDNAEGKLLPYLTANLQFEVNRCTDILLLSNNALRWRPKLDDVHPEHRDEYKRFLESKKSSERSVSPAERFNRTYLWVPEGDYVRPIPVQTGLTDGNMTQIVQGNVDEGSDVIARENPQHNSTATINPFVPAGPGKKKQ